MGLLESVYESALAIEFELAGLKFARQMALEVGYRGQKVGDLRVDFLVADEVVVEIKSVDRYDPVFDAQVMTYLKVTEKRIGLLINFNKQMVKDGIKRFIL